MCRPQRSGEFESGFLQRRVSTTFNLLGDGLRDRLDPRHAAAEVTT
jgi:hypothetical protein